MRAGNGGRGIVTDLQIIHEGRGGYIAIAGSRYVIEHVQDGQFCIYFPSGNRPRDRDRHLAALEQLCRAEPAKWRIVRRDRRGRSPRA